jgi:hypothetical protein
MNPPQKPTKGWWYMIPAIFISLAGLSLFFFLLWSGISDPTHVNSAKDKLMCGLLILLSLSIFTWLYYKAVCYETELEEQINGKRSSL